MKLALRRIPFVLMVAIGGSYVLLRAILPILSPFHVDIEIHNAVVFWYFADRAAVLDHTCRVIHDLAQGHHAALPAWESGTA